MSLLFVPLTTVAMDPIPRERMGNATSLFNLMRNIGGSVGIAMTGTMLARQQQATTVAARRERHGLRSGVAVDASRRCEAAFMAAGADVVTATNRALRGAVRHGAAAGVDGVVRRALPAARAAVPGAAAARAADEAAAQRGGGPHEQRRTDAAVRARSLRRGMASKRVTLHAVNGGARPSHSPAVLGVTLAAQTSRRQSARQPTRPSFAEWLGGRPHGGALARHPPGDRRRGARAASTSRCPSCSSATARRPRRSCPSRPTSTDGSPRRGSGRGREMFARTSRLLEQVAAQLRRAGAHHRRHLGRGVELRPLQRRPPDRRGARDAGVGSAPRDVLPSASCSTRSRSSTAATSSSPGCRAPGPAPWASRSSCRRAISSSPRTSTATAGATSGDAGRRLRVDRQLPEGTRLGSRRSRGGARSASRKEAASGSQRKRRAARRHLPRHARHDRRASARRVAARSASHCRAAARCPKPTLEALAGRGHERATFSSTRITTRCSNTTARTPTRSAWRCSAIARCASSAAGPPSQAERPAATSARAILSVVELSHGAARSSTIAVCSSPARLRTEEPVPSGGWASAVRCGQCKTSSQSDASPLEVVIAAPTSIGWSHARRCQSWSTTGRRGAAPAGWSHPNSRKSRARADGRFLVVKVNTDALSDLGAALRHPVDPDARGLLGRPRGRAHGRRAAGRGHRAFIAQATR